MAPAIDRLYGQVNMGHVGGSNGDECILEQKTPRSPVADGRTVAQMLVAIAESADRGEEVAVRR